MSDFFLFRLFTGLVIVVVMSRNFSTVLRIDRSPRKNITNVYRCQTRKLICPVCQNLKIEINEIATNYCEILAPNYLFLNATHAHIT